IDVGHGVQCKVCGERCKHGWALAPMTSNGIAAWLIGDFPTQLVLDMCADDVIKGRLRLESEIARPLCVEPLGPTGNDSLDKFVRWAANARGHFVARDTA